MNIEIADRLIKMRKAHGFSQEELASELGISRQAVSKWERAESSPDTDNLIMLSRLYGVSLDALLATDEEIPRPEPEEAAEPVKKAGREGVHISLSKGINVRDDDGSRVHIGWDGIRVSDADDEPEEDGDFYDSFIGDAIEDIEVDDTGVTFTENGERVHHDWNDQKKDGARRFVRKEYSDETGKWRSVVIDESGRKVVIDTKKEPDFDKESGSFKSDAGGFPYAVLVTGVFLLLGFLKGWWHPAWLLFLTIPIYYPIASSIRKNSLSWLDIAVPVVVTGAYVALGIVFKAWHPLWLMLLAIPLYYAVSSMLKHRSGRATGVYAIAVTIAYLALGFVFGEKAWTCGWLLYLTVPMVSSIENSVRTHAGIKWLNRFPWELLIVAGYLFVGLMYGIWHPTWIVFLLIPVWRWIVSAIAGSKKTEASYVEAQDSEEVEAFAEEDEE